MSDSTAHPAPSRRFNVRARHDGHGSHHHVFGASFEDAAVAFIERWGSSVDADGAVSVLVSDEHGCERCFSVDLEHGEAAPCA